MANFIKIVNRINRLMDTWPLKAANTARNFFDDSFENKGFTDKKLEKWDPVYKHGLEKDRPLVDSGSLRSNIFAEADGKGEAVVYADTAYAEYHNEGAGNLPERKFMGNSEVLEEQLEADLMNALDKIFDL